MILVPLIQLFHHHLLFLLRNLFGKARSIARINLNEETMLVLEDLAATRLVLIDLNVLISNSKSMPSIKAFKRPMATSLTTHNRKKWVTVDYLISMMTRLRTLMSLMGAKKDLDPMLLSKTSKRV